MPEIETANLFQCYVGLNWSQFWAYCFLHRNSITATKTFATCTNAQN